MKLPNSVYFSDEIFLPEMPKATNLREALFIFKKNAPEIIWNTLGTFENNPCTLPQAETILQGVSVAGLYLDDVLQVRRFGYACKELEIMLNDKTFGLTKDCACRLHNIIGREEALEWGVFRDRVVHLRNVSYEPPSPECLDSLFEQGMESIKQISSVQIRSLMIFLYMSRMQFFFDCNKRTAMLMMYGELMRNNINVFIIPKLKQGEFNAIMKDFYNTGNADNALLFLSELASN